MNIKVKNVALYNVFISSIGSTIIQIPTVITLQSLDIITRDIRKDNPSYQVSSYFGIVISYFTAAAFNLYLPSIIDAIGTKMTILLGFLLNFAYFLQFLFELPWFYYAECVLCGVASALYWTGQANYLILNSRTKHMARNTGIFWTLVHLGSIIANLICLCYITDDMGRKKRLYFVLIMVGINCLGCLLITFYGKCEFSRVKIGCKNKILETTNLYLTKHTLVLSTTMLYTGLESSLCFGIYSNTLANVAEFSQMEDATIIATSVFLTAVGEAGGGIFFGILGYKIRIWGNYSIVFIGFCLHLICFAAILLTIPKVALKTDTRDKAFVNSSLTLALTCSFMLGLGDSAFVTQCYDILASTIVDKSDDMFSIFNCLRCIGFGIGYCLAMTDLYIYISIVLLFDLFALGCFYVFETRTSYKPEFEKIPLNKKGEKISRIVTFQLSKE